MKVLTIEATIENGQIRLPDGTTLPDSTKVYIIVPEVEAPSAIHIRSPLLVNAEQASDFEKQVIEVSSDDGE